MLYFSAKIEYGLNLLIELAKTKDLISLKEISNKTGMPYRFLTKMSADLIKAKLVKSKEGKNGGYILIKNPSQISVKEILEALGEPLTFARCISRHSCELNLQKKCKMKIIWQRIGKNINKELNKITLKDLV